VDTPIAVQHTWMETPLRGTPRSRIDKKEPFVIWESSSLSHICFLIRYNSIRQYRGIRHYLGGVMAKAADKAKNKSAFMKPVRPSEHLAKIVGTEPLPRTEVTKKIWAHIKKHKLQNPNNKREILADDKLQPIFGAKKLDMFQMTKAVNKHLK
jgi:upstream activation factor subunit UAF30